MIQTLPLNPDDVAVTHLPGGVTVSTRAVRHVGARPGEEITNYETMILIPDTRDRAHAGGQHVEIVAALMAGAPLEAIGRVEPGDPATPCRYERDGDRCLLPADHVDSGRWHAGLGWTASLGATTKED